MHFEEVCRRCKTGMSGWCIVCLYCSSETLTGWKGEVLHFYSALLRLHWECYVESWDPQYKRDMDILQWIQWWDIKMIKDLEHLSYKRLRELGFSRWEEKGSGLRRDLTNVYKYLIRWCKENGARLFSVVSSDRSKANGHKLKYKKFCSA